jgi:glycosidase
VPVQIEQNAPTTLRDASLLPRGRVFPSPTAWRDQILYFLLPDRFSDGGEAQRPPFDRNNPDQHRAADTHAWMTAGTRFQGGTLAGVTSKLDYLRDLGMTALWIGPVWRQRADLHTYHGYGIQNFLDVDPRFGTRQDLRDLVDAAHDRGMYVLLDVIYNHSGNNWFYDHNSLPLDQVGYRYAPPYGVHGWRSAAGLSTSEIHTVDDGVWPVEFQDAGYYTRAGRIGRWDPEPWENPLHDENEFRRGDFYDLKNLEVRERVLASLLDVYRYWIALCDCDGMRIDTVKHVPFEASRNFCGGIREFAESIGKENFLLLGEVTGGSGMARDYLDIFGRNLDAVLDIGDPSARLSGMVKGFRNPADFFVQFGGHDGLGSHRVVGRYHVSIVDDHDMVGRDKRRFSAGNTTPTRDAQAAHAVGVQLTTLGTPCVYYGTEQAFDGSDARHDPAFEPLDEWGGVPGADRYVRESMFGGTFGAFATEGCHFFDATHPAYLRIAAIARVRQHPLVGRPLRRGRQYFREISTGGAFRFPAGGELIGWSRILYDQEVVVCLNCDGVAARTAQVTVDASLHPANSSFTIQYRSDWTDDQLRNPPQETISVQAVDGRSVISMALPPAGMVILA